MPTPVRLEIRLLVLSVVGAVAVPDCYMKGTQLLRSKVELAPSNFICVFTLLNFENQKQNDGPGGLH